METIILDVVHEKCSNAILALVMMIIIDDDDDDDDLSLQAGHDHSFFTTYKN